MDEYKWDVLADAAFAGDLEERPGEGAGVWV
jgi:hypothetical protein